MTGGEPTRALGSAYVLYERVGRGASGDVWRGLDSRTGAPVAVKVLRSVFAQQTDIVEGFLRERAILMRLHDPHIVQLRDLVVESDTVALVTDFAAGGDLRSRLADGPLPVLEALDIVCQVLDGLDAAHRRGVVHRDLKPENALVEGEGDDMVVRITDFGIATLIGSTESSDPLSLVGSPEYMAPEVIEARRTTPGADLYSAGILLYELIAGRTPFAGGAPMAVLRRHVQEPAPRIPDIRDDVWEIIASLLAKDPADRPASARTAARRLRAIAGEIAGTPRLDPLLDEVEVDAPDQAISPSSVWDPSSEEDTTVVRTRRDAAAARRRRLTWTAAGVAIVLVGAGAAIGVRALARHRNTASVPHVTFVGVPSLQFTGPQLETVITRVWQVSGRTADSVTVTLNVRNVGAGHVGTVLEPPLRGLTSLPPFPVALAPGASTRLVYSFRAHQPTGLDVSQLTAWEHELNGSLLAAYRVLASAHTDSRFLRLVAGERAFLNVSGVSTRGEPAPPTLLSGILWSSSERSVVEVVQGASPGGGPVVIARGRGAAALHAQVGVDRMEVNVVVTGAPGPVARGPCEPGVDAPDDLSSMVDTTLLNDGLRSWVIVGGARLPYPGATLQGKTLPAGEVGPISSIPRDGTTVTEPDGTTWLIAARSRIRTLPNGDAVPVPAGSLDAIPQFGRGAAFTDGTLVHVPGQPVQVYRVNSWSPAQSVCAHASVVDVPAGTPVPK